MVEEVEDDQEENHIIDPIVNILLTIIVGNNLREKTVDIIEGHL